MLNYTLLLWDTQAWQQVATVADERSARKLLKKSLKQARRELKGQRVSFGVIRWPASWSAVELLDAIARVPAPGVSPHHLNTSKVKIDLGRHFSELPNG